MYGIVPLVQLHVFPKAPPSGRHVTVLVEGGGGGGEGTITIEAHVATNTYILANMKVW